MSRSEIAFVALADRALHAASGDALLSVLPCKEMRMKWILVFAAIAFAAKPSLGAPTPPDNVTYTNGKYVLTTATPPPSVCSPSELVPAPDPAPSPEISDAKRKAAIPPAVVALPVAPPASKRFSISITPECQKSLTLPVVTMDKQGLKSASGQVLGGTIRVFTLEPREVDLDTTREHGPFLVIGSDSNVYLLAAVGVDACHQATYGVEKPDLEIDLEPGGSVRLSPSRNVVEPNHGLVVLVCHDPTEALTVAWGGTRGLTRADATTSLPPSVGIRAEAIGKLRQPQVARFTFSPRTAGKADLSIWKSTDTTGTPSFSVELEVEPLYWGAVRFGLGTLLGRWNNYSIATASGSHTPEVRGESETVGLELVSGFAPYFFDLPWGGRSQSGGHNSFVAPFIGFGVIGTNPTGGVQALSSVHFGLDFEAADNLSIALTFVLRRTKELASDYEVGSPVAAALTIDNITVEKWRPGFAIVLNATPSFLQFATGGSTTTSTGGKP